MIFSRLVCVLVLTASVCSLPSTAWGQDWLPTIPVGTTEVKLELHSQGFNGNVLGIDQILPSKLVAIPDNSGRMVVSTLGGLLRIMDEDGNISTSNSGVYLDTNTSETNIEPYAYGVTSVAFHPDFANSGQPGFGKLYTLVTESPKVSPAGYDFIPVVGSDNNHAALLVEYSVDANAIASDVLVTSGSGQNVTRRELFIAQEPDNEHNFCDLAFDANGLLYISAGDGLFNYNGAVNDEAQNAQELGSVLGKVLRIDPLGNNSANGNYGIVAGNVFAADSDPNTLAEIYSYGHRNPWRISIDQVSGDIVVAEVGHFNIEEVNKSINGANFGWPAMEGSFLINPDDGFDLTPDVGDAFATANGIVSPVFEYDHQDGRSVTGGFVYRGSNCPTLLGKYIFADFTGGSVATNPRLFAGDLDSGQFEQLLVAAGSTSLGQPVSFGEDADGELYVVSLDGRVLSVSEIPLDVTPLSIFCSDFENLVAGPEYSPIGSGWQFMHNAPSGTYFGDAPQGRQISNLADAEGDPGKSFGQTNGAGDELDPNGGGNKYLNIYSDYDNSSRSSNPKFDFVNQVFQEQNFTADDAILGQTYTFSFDYAGAESPYGVAENPDSTAAAFIRVFDGANKLLEEQMFDTSSATTLAFVRGKVSLTMDPAWEDGGVIQFGFTSTSSLYEPTGVYYDNVCFAVLGDANNDGALSNLDIASFVLALTDLATYQAMFPEVDPGCVLDMNCDGVFDNTDIAAFVTALTK